MTGTNKTKGGSTLCAAAVFILLAVAVLLTPMTAHAAENPLGITVRQTVIAPPSAANDTFTYRLKPLGQGIPMPGESVDERYTFTISGNSGAEIGPLRYARQGVYRYELFQVTEAEKPGWTIDKRVYTIEVHVSEALKISLVVMNADGTKEKGIIFNHTYHSNESKPDDKNEPGGGTKPGGGGKPGGGEPGPFTGDETKAALFFSLFVLSGAAATGTAVYFAAGKRRKEEVPHETQ